MAKHRMRLRVQYIVEYDVEASQYDTNDPREMAKIDQEAIEYDPQTTLKGLFDVLPHGDLNFSVEPVISIAEAAGLKVAL